MTEQSRQEMLKNLSPELREEFYKFEIDILERRIYNKEKNIIFLQVLVAIQSILVILMGILK